MIFLVYETLKEEKYIKKKFSPIDPIYSSI